MRPRLFAVPRSRPLVLAIVATLCAAALVLFVQHRTLTTLGSQTRTILRQVAQQTAGDIVFEARRALDGPVFDTLTAVNHPELKAGRLDLVAAEFEAALVDYPHVERFFVWTADTERVAPGEVLFRGRGLSPTEDTRLVSLGSMPDLRAVSLERDPALGTAIIELAHRYMPEQRIYATGEGLAGGRQALLRLFWTDARRVDYFAILGYVVDPATGGRRLFETLHERSVAALLGQRGGEVPLDYRVVDDHGATVFGGAAPGDASTAVMPMLFYPVDRINTRLSGALEPHPWRVEVSATPPTGFAAISRGYWPTILSLVLMLVALGLTALANRRASELTRMQADFISHVTHQLKTPLSLLSAASETVSMDRARSPEKLAQYIGIINGEVAHLSALVQRILEYSQLQERPGFEFEAVDLRTLVRETVAAFERSLAGRQFRFPLEEAGPAPSVMADPAALEQILVNLLDNAVKYGGEDKLVRVRLRSSANTAIIEVIDHGIGIAPEEHERIFDRFHRAAGRPPNRQGFGLGLSIVQELARAHGGRVEVESAVGKGSTFRVVLPARAAGRAWTDRPAEGDPSHGEAA